MATYTSQEDSYSVKYPAGWTREEEGVANTVAFVAGKSSVATQVISGIPPSQSMDKITERFFTSYREGADMFKTANERTVTLPNGHSGRAVDFTARESSSVFRGRAIFARANQQIYDVIILVPDRVYTPTTKKGMTTIIKSLTIE